MIKPLLFFWCYRSISPSLGAGRVETAKQAGLVVREEGPGRGIGVEWAGYDVQGPMRSEGEKVGMRGPERRSQLGTWVQSGFLKQWFPYSGCELEVVTVPT
jgi:hypothetical protein